MFDLTVAPDDCFLDAKAMAQRLANRMKSAKRDGCCRCLLHRPDAENGFAIVSAIFLLVVLAALGGFMLTFSNAQHMSATQDLQGARALQAARAGIDWGAYQILQGGNPGCTGAPVLGGTLAGFNLNVSCAAFGPYTEGTNTFSLYQITSTASMGTLGSTTYIERQMQATIAH